MANLSITNSFTSGTTIIASEMNTNFTDVSGYINARNGGSTDWDFVSSAGLITAKALVQANDGAVGGPAYSFTSDTDTGIFRSGTNILNLVTAGSTALQIDAAGIITTPLQSSFLVTAPVNTANVTGNGTLFTIEYDTEIFDQNADFNTGTFTFTAPVTGRYLLTASCIMITSTADGQTSGVFQIVTSNRTYTLFTSQVQDATERFSRTVIADMDANDTATVNITINGGTQISELDNDAKSATFSGSLIN